MTVGAAFISDRGDLYLPGCIESFLEQPGSEMIDASITVDDRDHLFGMAGAVQRAWTWALDQHCDYLVHIEEDFRFHDFPIAAMIDILEENPQLAQVVLKRQPWSARESEAGGIVELHPDYFTDHPTHLEHEWIFSLNPCVIPAHILSLGWPDGNEAEFTKTCRKWGFRFAFYGRRSDPPRCLHVGSERGVGWRL